ncbi:hypothetical protein [Deinococcus sp.]|uniref:hypothetical protein n=1 Tax=Deinococcus sp. TaxID=47478 RepID=UPI003C7B59AC
MNGTEQPAARRGDVTDRTKPTRRAYQAPRVTLLGEWTALTLANSRPDIIMFPAFLKTYS